MKRGSGWLTRLQQAGDVERLVLLIEDLLATRR